ncbi:phage tail-collar fiber domain-containing protein [Thalassospira marina]|uniref:Phage tail fibre protein N-terminal domain-containing protein n=1 Tax=Thalassospira marina TaxID=2048283 RepID=A0A2N3KX04_9PROT|nr:phage tail protein [Thalassospira marina]PKR55058.1 hypothetical protein COO20_06635 [Thalassospira marina]
MSELSLSPVLTSAGLAAVAAAHGQGLQAKITHIALGDGGYAVRDATDAPLAAAQARTDMQSEQVRVTVYAGAIPGPQQIVVEARIDAGKPNFWVKEVGFFLEDGTLFAIWSSDALNLGFRGDLVPWVFRFALAWTQLPENAVTVEFSGDAGYSDLWGLLNDHITSKDPHPSQIEPAFRTDCEPCLLEFAEPGENLPAPFVFSQPGKGIGFNAAGQYTMVEPGRQRDWFDAETREYLGKLTLPTYRNSCANWNATPTDTTGVQGPYGDANAVLTVVDDTQELGKVHILKQLLREGTLNGNVFKVDNSLGSSSVYVAIDGNTSSPGAVTTISAWCRTTNGGRIDMAGGFGAQNFTNSEYERIHKTVDMPDDRSGKCAIIAEAGSTVWFILNQCEVNAAPSFVPVITQGAAAVTTADVLTIGPVEIGDNLVENGTFDADLTGWINPDGYWQWSSGLAYHPSGDELKPLYWPITPGKRYRVSMDVELVAGQFNVFTDTDAATTGTEISIRNIASDGNHSFDFTAQGSMLGIRRAPVVVTEGYIDNVRIVELVPFEGWDSDAKGHTFLIDAFSPLGTDSATNLMQVYDDTNTNTIEIYEFRHGDVKDIRSSYRVGTNRLFCDTTADARDELTVSRTEHETLSVKSASSPLQTTFAENRYPLGLCRILFGKLWWGPQSELTIKRFAVYNLPLSDSNLNAMVKK